MKHQFLCKRNFIQKSEFCPQPRLKQKVDSGIEFINGEIYIGEDSIYGAIIITDKIGRSRLFSLPYRRSKYDCDIFWGRPFEEFFYYDEEFINKKRFDILEKILNEKFCEL